MGFLRDIGAPGVIVLVLAALLIFGPKRLPELGESIGKMFTSFKKSISGLTDDESSSDKNENEKENKQGFHGLPGSDCDDGGNVGFGICAGTYW